MSSNISPLNIVILPDKKVNKKALELSQKISENFDTYFSLDNKGLTFYPHITLYQTVYPSKNIPLLKQKLSEFAKKLSPFKVKLSRVSSAFDTWISWELLKTKELMDLELQILNLANPLREGIIPKGLKEIAQSIKDKEEIENYGALLLKDRYTPHITLSRLKNPLNMPEALKILDQKIDYEFIVDKLYLGNLGESGTVNEIYDKFPLSSLRSS